MNNSDDSVVLGPLSSLAREEGITDISITSDGRVWADCGHGMKERSLDVGILSSETVRNFAIQLCASLGKRLDDSCPIADASTVHGLRVHAVLEPIVAQGASLSIRLPQPGLLSLDDLCDRRMMPGTWKKLIQELIYAKKNILVCGGTGAGKTTLVKALLSHIDESERVVLIEEIRELASSMHTNGESLVVRETNVEGRGAITLSELVQATVRMRPDRIVLGECRGEEIADLLRALNSGHEGSIATIHADNIERVPARMSALGLLAHIDIPAMALLASGAFPVVIHVARDTSGRHISQIGTLEIDDVYNLRGKVLARWNGHDEPIYEPEFFGWVDSLTPLKQSNFQSETVPVSSIQALSPLRYTNLADVHGDETQEFSVISGLSKQIG